MCNKWCSSVFFNFCFFFIELHSSAKAIPWLEGQPFINPLPTLNQLITNPFMNTSTHQHLISISVYNMSLYARHCPCFLFPFWRCQSKALTGWITSTIKIKIYVNAIIAWCHGYIHKSWHCSHVCLDSTLCDGDYSQPLNHSLIMITIRDPVHIRGRVGGQSTILTSPMSVLGTI